MLTGLLPELDDNLRPLAIYWLGRARVAPAEQAQRRAGLLNLLELPAVYGDQQPELAAAGLALAVQVLSELGDVKGSIAVRRELLDRYGQTWHARQLRNETEKADEHP
jgi:hypothetical protein